MIKSITLALSILLVLYIMYRIDHKEKIWYNNDPIQETFFDTLDAVLDSMESNNAL